MFKLLLVVAVAAAADLEAPVISLNLAGHGHESDQAHQSASNFADECCNGVGCSGGDCALPVASAYDHHDGDISSAITIEYAMFVLSDPGCDPVQTNQTLSQSEFDARLQPNAFRGEFVLRYDVADSAGNAAETVTYALIMRDTISPTYQGTDITQTKPYGAVHTQFNAIPLIQFQDTYDADYVKVDFDHDGTVTTLESSNSTVCAAPCEYQVPDATKTSGYLCSGTTVEAKAYDYADIFGDNNADNVATFTFGYELTDAGAPSITLAQPESAMITTTECTGTYANGASNVYPYKSASVTSEDQSCNCMTGQSLVETAATVNQCQFACNTVYTNNTIASSNQDGTVVVTCQALDFLNKEKVVSSSAIVISDTTPPTLTLNEDEATYKNNVTDCDPTQENCNTQTYFYNVSYSEGSQKNYQHSSEIQHSAGYLADASALEALADHFHCADVCHNNVTVTTSWHKTNGENPDGEGGLCALTDNWEQQVSIIDVATYVLKYVCTDEVGNSAQACRTIYNQDHTVPILNFIAQDNDKGPCKGAQMTCTGVAAGDGNYVDEGATCSDTVDGVISELVEVSGDVVSLANIDTYHITYDCTDSAGNEAQSIVRTVIVYDETCPTCVVSSDTNDITIEASFPYDDDAVTCSDDRPFTAGQRDFSKTATTTDIVDVEDTGVYVLTYHATDLAGNTNFNAYNDQIACGVCDPASGDNCFTGGPFTGVNQTRTVTVQDTLRPIITLKDQMDLMEESSSSVNGWLLGAIASSVAGVALVGYAVTRRSQIATSVPV
jgi:hypothetical protein